MKTYEKFDQEYQLLVEEKRRWLTSFEKLKFHIDEAKDFHELKEFVLSSINSFETSFNRELKNQVARNDAQTFNLHNKMEHLENRISEMEKSLSYSWQERPEEDTESEISDLKKTISRLNTTN